MTWNKGAEKLTGFAADEAIGRFVADVYIPAINRETIATESKVNIAAFEHEPALVRRRDLMVQRKDGALVEVSLAQSALLDSGGESVGTYRRCAISASNAAPNVSRRSSQP